MANLKTSLTKRGYETLINRGAFDTFAYFSVSDVLRYDIISSTPQDLDTMLDISGNRVVRNNLKTCNKSLVSPINMDTLTEVQEETTKNRLSIKMGLSEDCDGTYEQSNVKATIHLQRWMNYLEATILAGYSHDAKLRIPILDNIQIYEEESNPITDGFDVIKRYTGISPIFEFSSDTDKINYKNMNSYLMEVVKGRVVQASTLNQKFPSPLQLTFSSIKGRDGVNISGHNVGLTMNPFTFGYVAIKNEEKTNTPNLKHFLTITEFESLENIDSVYKIVSPACVMGRLETDLFVWNNVENLETKQQGSGLLLFGFQNNDKVNLTTRMINRLKSHMEYYGTESVTGVYEYQTSLKIVNNRVQDKTYKNVIGGSLTVVLKYDSSDIISSYGQILEIE